MMKRNILGAVALIALPAASQAEFNYTFVDFEYVDVEYEIGPFDVDGDGFAIAGQFVVAESFFVGGSYEDYSFDSNVDGELLEIFGGYFHPLNEELDFIATFGWVDAEVSSGGPSFDDDGLSLGGGVRHAVNDDLEVEAMLNHVDFDNGGSDTGVELRGRYFFNEDFAVTAQLDLGKDIETFRIGIRFEF
jgi:hypothetical protein